MNKWLVIVSLILVFGLGLVLGAIGAGVMARHRMARGIEGRSPAMRLMVIQRLNHELRLDAVQRAELERVLQRTHAELMQVRRQHQPEVEAIIARGVADMKPCLRPDQQKKLDQLLEKARQRWRQPGPPPEKPSAP